MLDLLSINLKLDKGNTFNFSPINTTKKYFVASKGSLDKCNIASFAMYPDG